MVNQNQSNESCQNNHNTLDEKTKLAIVRTRLAAERTLMSWIRTSFSMIGFGFTIIKFFEYLSQSNPAKMHPSGSRHLGIFLIMLGIFCLIPGIIEHRKDLKQLKSMDRTSPVWSYALIVAILVGLIGLYALTSALTTQRFSNNSAAISKTEINIRS